MLLRQFHCGNDLLTHIRENTDFLQQKPQQLQVPREISKAEIRNVQKAWATHLIQSFLNTCSDQ